MTKFVRRIHREGFSSKIPKPNFGMTSVRKKH
ncbi:hypothetical protein ACHAXS_009771 [Conticribra weissflogii]